MNHSTASGALRSGLCLAAIAILMSCTTSCVREQTLAPSTSLPESKETAKGRSSDFPLHTAQKKEAAEIQGSGPASPRSTPASRSSTTTPSELSPSDEKPANEVTPTELAYDEERREMVTRQLAARDIVDRPVLDAMLRVPRHEFMPANVRHRAYDDSPAPIGHRQTISQPYIVGLMTQLVEPESHKKALDIGTGSGYQAAVLAELVEHVYSIEIVKPLAKDARARLQTLGYKNVTVRHGDGYGGWEAESPFDIIIVAAAPDHVPQPLVDQLAAGGKMVIPVGRYFQNLLVIEKDQDGKVTQKNVAPVAFVPMTGAAQKK